MESIKFEGYENLTRFVEFNYKDSLLGFRILE